MLNYKKPAFWIIVVALILCVVVAICFLTIRPNDSGNTDTTTTTTTNQGTTTTTSPDNNSTTTTPDNNPTTDNSSSTANPVESMKTLNKVHYYDIDGERGQEFCMIIPIDHDRFRIIVVGGDETIPKYYAIYNCNDMHSHQFAQTDDGRVGIIAISNDNDRSPADSRPFWDTFMDISVENGRIVLREDGKVIEPCDLGPEPLYGSTVDPSNYFFDSRNSISYQLRGDYRTSEETIALGYMKYAASESETPKTYWLLSVIDYDNPELTTYISLGACEDFNFFKHGYGNKYGELPEDEIFIEDAEAERLYARILYQDGGYTISHLN